MKDWLLKEDKPKIGRPKLANEVVLKKAKISIVLSLFLCFMLFFSFVSYLEGSTPLKLAHHLTIEKIFGSIKNNNGFLVNDKYDDDYNYVMEFNIPDVIKNYSGSYKYWLYELDDDEWKEKENKVITNDVRNFKINIKSLRNKNKTWKIKLQITNASKKVKSYAPTGWSFNSSDENYKMYAYKIFTVKGYYSPVMLKETHEAKISKNKITVTTPKKNPRQFIISFPDDNSYDVIVKYTDVNSKNIILKNKKNISKKLVVEVPNVNKSTKVTFKIHGLNIKSKKLSNWTSLSNNSDYITNTYLLKPENAYKN